MTATDDGQPPVGPAGPPVAPAPDRVTMVRHLLEEYPDARVSAHSPAGESIVLPPGLLLKPANKGGTGPSLGAVITEDRSAVIDAFGSARENATSSVSARFIDDPAVAATVHMIDVRPAHDAIIAVIVGRSKPAFPGRRRDVDEDRDTPLVATITKTDIATILTIDEATTKILGWTSEDMVGRSSLDFIHPDDQALSLESWFDGIAAPGRSRRVRLRHRTRAGGWTWFEITNNNLLQSDSHCVLAEMVDISKEMAVQELLGRLTQALPLGVFQMDVDRRIVYNNSRLLDMVEMNSAYSLDELLANRMPRTNDTLEEAVEAVFSRCADQDIEIELYLAGDVQPHHYQLHLRPLVEQAGTTTGAIGCLVDVTESVLLRQALEHRATFDNLTGCYNRPAITAALHALVHSPADFGVGLALFFIDLDGFKSVNDTFGHAAGDQLLTIVAERLRSLIREQDLLGRIGGDEFIVVCPGLPDAGAALDLGQRINAAVSGDASLEVGMVPVSASIGVSWSALGELDEDLLISHADIAMYTAKRNAAGQVYLYTPQVEAMRPRTRSIASLTTARGGHGPLLAPDA